MSSVLDRLESVVVAVGDLESATQAYARLLGIQPQPVERDDEISRSRFVLANASLDLVSPSEKTSKSWLSLWLDKRGEGALGLVFHCADVEAIESTLVDRGVQVLDDVEPFGAALAPGATRGIPTWLSDLGGQGPAATPEKDCVFGIDHAVIRTNDADATRNVLEKGLGVRVALDRSFEEFGMRLIFCRIAGVTLEVAAALENKDDAVGEQDRLWGFTWQVQDIDAAHARLLAESFELSEVRPGRRPGTQVFTVRNGTCGVPTLILSGVPS